MSTGPILDPPDEQNDFHAAYIRRVIATYDHVTGGDLVHEAGLDKAALGRSAWFGNFALLTHRGDEAATLNYGNAFALRLWEMDWSALIATPSNATAPQEDRAARDTALQAVASAGFVRGYSGRRISRTGRLFLIKNVTIWRLRDGSGQAFGVGAFFRDFEAL